MENLEKDFDFYVDADLKSYSGEWLLLSNKQILSHNKNLKKIMNDLKEKFSSEKPLLVKIPENSKMLW